MKALKDVHSTDLYRNTGNKSSPTTIDQRIFTDLNLLRSMVVNINCQLDGIYNHLGDKSLGISVSDQLDEANGVERTSGKHVPFHGLQSQTTHKGETYPSTNIHCSGFPDCRYMTRCLESLLP